MKTFVSSRRRRLLLRTRFVTSPGPLYRFFPLRIRAQILYVGVYFFPTLAIYALQAAGVVGNPVLGTGAQDQASAFPGYGQTVTRSQAQLTQQVGWQSYLILSAYGT